MDTVEQFLAEERKRVNHQSFLAASEVALRNYITPVQKHIKVYTEAYEEYRTMYNESAAPKVKTPYLGFGNVRDRNELTQALTQFKANFKEAQDFHAMWELHKATMQNDTQVLHHTIDSVLAEFKEQLL